MLRDPTFSTCRLAIWSQVATLCLAASCAHAAEQADSITVAQKIPQVEQKQEETRNKATEVNWFSQSVSLYGSRHISFAPTPVDDIYAEYEYVGRQGPLELYGYVDVNKVLGIGNRNSRGIWDKGSPVFMEHNPRLSLDSALNKPLAFGPFSEFFVAVDWLYDVGTNRSNRSSVLYAGFGANIKTGTPWTVATNIYKRRMGDNYGGLNEHSWDGYRAEIKYFGPIASFSDGSSLSLIGYVHHDFGSKLPDLGGSGFSKDMTVFANRLVYRVNNWRFNATAYYFHNSGNVTNGTVLNYGAGDFRARTTGWGYSLGVGYYF